MLVAFFTIFFSFFFSLLYATPEWDDDFCYNQPPVSRMHSGRNCFNFTISPSSATLVSSVTQTFSLSFSALSVYVLPPCPSGASPVPLGSVNWADFITSDQSSRECTPRGTCSSFSTSTWFWTNWREDNIVDSATACEIPAQFSNAVWLQDASSGTKYFASSALSLSNSEVSFVFSGLPAGECFVLYVAPVFNIKRPFHTNAFYNNDFEGRHYVYTAGGLGKCPSVPPLYETPKYCMDATLPDVFDGVISSQPSSSTVTQTIRKPCSTNSSQICLESTIAARSEDTFLSWNIASFDEDGHTYRVSSSTVSLSQPREVTFVVPFIWEFDQSAKMELYGPGRTVDLEMIYEKLTNEQLSNLHDEVDSYSDNGGSGTWEAYSFRRGDFLNRTIVPMLDTDDLYWCPLDSGFCAGTPFAFQEPGFFISPIAQWTSLNGTYLYYRPASDAKTCTELSDPVPWDLQCTGSDLRNPKIPFLQNVFHSRLSDKLDSFSLFVNHGVWIGSASEVSVNGNSLSLLDRYNDSNSQFSITAQIENAFSDPLWGATRPFLYQNFENQAEDPNSWRFLLKDSHLKCGDPDALTIRHATDGCATKFGNCLSNTYYDLYRNRSHSLSSLSHLDRLTGMMTPSTQAHFGFPSSKRLHVQYTSSRQPILDNVQVDPSGYPLRNAPCRPEGNCGWNGRGNPQPEGFSRFVMVPNFNRYIVEFPFSGLLEPKVCDLITSWTPLNSTTGSIGVQFFNCGDLEGTFVSSMQCTEGVMTSQGVKSTVVASQSLGTMNIPITFNFSSSSGGVCNISVSVVTKPLWSLNNKSAQTSVVIPISVVTCDPVIQCSGHGTCLPAGGCSCSPPWQGSNCSECPEHMYGSACQVFCEPNITCNSHGTCHPKLGLCMCQAPWTGSNCTMDSCITSSIHPERTLSAYNFYEERECPTNSILRCRFFPHSLSHCSTQVCACYCLLPGDPSTNPCNLTLGYNPFP